MRLGLTPQHVTPQTLHERRRNRIVATSNNSACRQDPFGNMGRSVPPLSARAFPRSKFEQRASLTPNTNQPRPLQTHQDSSRSHRVPFLAAAKRRHLSSIQFSRQGIVAHIPLRPDFSNDRRQGPGAQVCRYHVRQCTWCSTSLARKWTSEGLKAFGSRRHFHCRQQLHSVGRRWFSA
jgi:hypothetical protein